MSEGVVNGKKNWFQHIDVQELLRSVWEAVILGDNKYFPGKSCYELADEYRRSSRSVKKCAKNFIYWQTAKAGAIGFAMGAPGGFAGLALIPGDLTACIYLQMRTAAVIGLLYGWDPKSDQMKTIAYYSMVGGSASGAAAQGAGNAGKKMFGVWLKGVSGAALSEINKKLGFRFITKFGTQGIINLVDFLPIIGGLVTGSMNAMLTNRAGWIAHRMLRKGPEEDVFLEGEFDEIEKSCRLSRETRICQCL